MLPLPTEATIEEKNSCTGRRHPTYHWTPQIIQEKIGFMHQDIITQTGWKNLEWEGVIGSLTSATIKMNFELKADMALVMRCSVSWVFDVTHWRQNKGLSRPRNKHREIFWSLLTTRAWQPDRWTQANQDEGYLPLTVFSHHTHGPWPILFTKNRYSPL